MAPKHRIFTTSVSSVYPLYLAKAEKKGRTREELDEIIRWLTGYTQPQLEAILKTPTDFESFFANAPTPNPVRASITGVICGVRIQEIQESTMREIRYLDKLVDELAKGKSMEKILRSQPSTTAVPSAPPRVESTPGATKARPAAAPTKMTFEGYLAGLQPAQREALEHLRRAIRAAAPKAEECICYGVPAYRLRGKFLVGFAAAARHCSFYPGSSVQSFQDELRNYPTSKGTVRFPVDRPLPAALVRKLVKARIASGGFDEKG
jgi:uncharacterized protein YdhG (YjbR/CyaY superfamily)